MTIEKIKEILAAQKDIDPALIKESAAFADLGLDSLDTVDVIMALEDAFGITFEQEEEITTIGALADLIDGKLSAQ